MIFYAMDDYCLDWEILLKINNSGYNY